MPILINMSQYFNLAEHAGQSDTDKIAEFYDITKIGFLDEPPHYGPVTGKSMLLEFDDCRQETIFLLKYSDIMNQE
jgi:hypothetical protein